MSPARAITSTSWLNAWSLRRGCQALGVELLTTDPRPELPLPAATASEATDWLLLTDERGLRQALAGNWRGRFLPARFPLSLLDDKWSFARWLADDPGGPQGLPQWAVAEAGAAAYPLMLKARHSWDGDAKLPRGWVCHNPGELDHRLAGLAAAGWRESQFFLQQWLGDGPLQLLSVGGFFDARDEARNLACVTRRLADYGGGPSSSSVLATVPDDHGLVALAKRVLRRLDYRGPYELEFVVVPGRPPLALELNPRFWMQHGVFIGSGNGLLRRYLERDTAEDHRDPPPQRVLWIDGTWLVRRLCRGDLRILRLLVDWRWRRGYRCTMTPDWRGLLAAAAWRLRRGA